MFEIFKKKSEPDEDILEIDLEEPVDCLCDFTFNFHWQHKGEKLDPSWKVPNNDVSFGDIVEHLKQGKDIKILGNVGHRLCSSMGTDLVYFGGNGKELNVGNVYVEGNVDTRMGISMTRGSLYIKGNIKEPVGNIVQVKSDVNGYKKFRSITDIMSNGLKNDSPMGFQLNGNQMIINDDMIKDTVGARLDVDGIITVNGNMDLSTGILMRRGSVRINGNTGKNTGALLNGGTVIVNGNTDDFTGIDMIKGNIIVNGDAGKFMAANKKNGNLFVHSGNPIPPTAQKSVNSSEQQCLVRLGLNPKKFIKFN